MKSMLRLGFLLVLLSGSAGAQSSPPTQYQGPVFSAVVTGVRDVKPLWTLAVDRAEYGEQTVLASANRVVVKIGGVLQARDIATGRVVWTQGKGKPGRLHAVAPSAHRRADNRGGTGPEHSGSASLPGNGVPLTQGA